MLTTETPFSYDRLLLTLPKKYIIINLSAIRSPIENMEWTPPWQSSESPVQCCSATTNLADQLKEFQVTSTTCFRRRLSFLGEYSLSKEFKAIVTLTIRFRTRVILKNLPLHRTPVKDKSLITIWN